MGPHSMLHPIGNIFKIMFKVILDMYILGDVEPYPIVGQGKIKIKLPNGNDWIL